MVYLYYNVKSQACCVLSSSSLTDTLRQDMSVNINELSLRQPAGWAYPQSNNGIREGQLLSLFQVLYLHSTSMMNLSKKWKRKREKVNCSAFQVFYLHYRVKHWWIYSKSEKGIERRQLISLSGFLFTLGVEHTHTIHEKLALIVDLSSMIEPIQKVKKA